VDPCLADEIKAEETYAVERWVNAGGTLICNGFTSFNEGGDYGEFFKDHLMAIDTAPNEPFRYTKVSETDFYQ